MYILVREAIVKKNRGHAINSIGHASLKCYLHGQNDKRMVDWVENSWRKVTCIVTDDELLEAEKAGDYVKVTESDLEGDPLITLAFVPRDDYPEVFKTFKLFS